MMAQTSAGEKKDGAQGARDGTVEALAGVTVQRTGGETPREVRLGDVWRDRTVVLAFVRHFG